MTFNEVIGQTEAKERIGKMLESGKIPHAMMLCGNIGFGTLPLAIAIASWLLGEREEGCSANTKAMLSKFQHPDLHFAFPVIRPAGTPSDRKITSDDFIKQWRQQLETNAYFGFEQWLECMDAQNQQAQIFAAEGDILSHKLSLKSSQGGYKVCIIWLPERMHQVFANKILKLLEEPPLDTVFILVSEEPHKLLETIRSRVQRIDIKRTEDEAIVNALTTKCGLEDSTAQRIAHIAAGNWLKALETVDAGNENHQFHDMFVMLMRQAYKRDTKGMKKWSETIASFGREKQKRMLLYFSNQIRENFMFNFKKQELVFLTEDEERFSQNFARFVNEANVIEIQELIDRVYRSIGQNANAKIEFFDMALQMIVLIKKGV